MDESKADKDVGIFQQTNSENNRKFRILPRGRPKGLPKTGGRKKQPSKTEINQKAWDEVLQGQAFSVPVEAIKLFFDKDTTNPLKFSILQFLAQYTTPAIKPIDKPDSESKADNEADTPAEIISIVKG